MSHGSQYQSNLVTTPSSCVVLTLQSILNQNLTCQPSSSYCRITMMLGTLQNELKPSFAADITKSFLLHPDKNGKHVCEENLHNGNEMGSTSVGRICIEIISIPTSSASLVVVIRAHKRLNIFAFLSSASVLLDLNINPPRSMNPLQENT